ncbi:DUF3679 domain-containing protein [Paenactinomyces guangxiensis]|uniref:DUF3679 domain-containing protein n=1 Tax=Paenactinomyces guangxiensis TaxID=1490290 RepID=A0A7W1WNL7_9BACL|nr:DUF3679 domain-containing protein [Paenactinomyces guangxiensis]MBA4493121.1 DUF3679 domain-containing protein [Paenactinomyces guangxiensis]MBH8590029.1 DUF3679 domain-containing protein [Paenactinomyces guangxiensis]
MRVTIQIIGLACMFILGIFLGIDSAEKNMHKMQGTEGGPRAIQITPQDGKIEIAVLGQVVETKNPVKQAEEKVEEVSGKAEAKSNRLAAIGNEVGTGMREITRKVVELLFSWVE